MSYLQQDFPCPCCTVGLLAPIALTEALGCFHCEQLFVWVAPGETLAKPAAHPWTGKRWRWVEGEWYGSSGLWLRSPVGVALLVVGSMLLAGLFYASQPSPRIQAFFVLLGVSSGLMLLLALIMLLSFRPWREW